MNSCFSTGTQPPPGRSEPGSGPAYETALSGRTIKFRNVLTGETRAVTWSPDLAAQECVPAFCIGMDKATSREIIQRLDGSGRLTLPQARPADLPGVGKFPRGSGAMLKMDNGTLLDPLTGKLSAPLAPVGTTCVGTAIPTFGFGFTGLGFGLGGATILGWGAGNAAANHPCTAQKITVIIGP